MSVNVIRALFAARKPAFWPTIRGRICAGLLLFAAGCAGMTQHALLVPQNASDPTTGSYGYLDRQLSETTYAVVYAGPEVMTDNTVESEVQLAAARARETASDLALWRAAEIALTRGFPAFAIRSAEVDVKQAIVGHDYRDNGNPVYDNIHGEALGYQTQIYFRPRASLTVELRTGKSPGTLDAGAVAEKMKRQYADATSRAIAPHTFYYFGPSVIVHAATDADRGHAKDNGPPQSGPHSEHPPYAGAAY